MVTHRVVTSPWSSLWTIRMRTEYEKSGTASNHLMALNSLANGSITHPLQSANLNRREERRVSLPENIGAMRSRD